MNVVSSKDVNVHVNKIKMVRPDENPKNCDLDLNVNWNIDFVKIDEKTLEYICVLTTIGELPLNFAIQGLIKCEDPKVDLEKRSGELSPLILDLGMETLVSMVNATKDISIQIDTVPEAHLVNTPRITLDNGC
jgi:hypothetical protein